jgi:hypothetical protein
MFSCCVVLRSESILTLVSVVTIYDVGPGVSIVDVGPGITTVGPGVSVVTVGPGVSMTETYVSVIVAVFVTVL